MSLVTNFSLKGKLALFVGGLATFLVAFGAVAFFTLNSLKLNGPTFALLVQQRDVIADSQPPPYFVVETHLLLHQMNAGPDEHELQALIGRERELRRAFETRHRQWVSQFPDGERMLVASYQPAVELFKLYDDEYLPAVLRGDDAAARRVLTGPIDARFREHRAAIEILVDRAAATWTRLAREADEKADRSVTLLFLIGMAGLVLTAGAGALMVRVVEVPLRQSVQVLDAVASGDLRPRLKVTARDEFGMMGGSVNRALDAIQETLAGASWNANILGQAATEMAAVSQQMSSNASETSAQSAAVSVAAEEVSANVQMVTAASQEMETSIREIARNAHLAATTAASAVVAAEGAHGAVGKLGESSQEIGNVIKVITSIAEQTNLLALNATIEAARAGEAGKGFGVVANEVKELARATAAATDDISRRIEAIQGDARGAVAAITEIHEMIGQIDGIQNTIASAVEEQTAATGEITRNMVEAARSVDEIARSIVGMTGTAESASTGASETRHAANQLARMATELEGLVARFKFESTRDRTGLARGPVGVPRDTAGTAQSSGAQPNSLLPGGQDSTEVRAADVTDLAA